MAPVIHSYNPCQRQDNPEHHPGLRHCHVPHHPSLSPVRAGLHQHIHLPGHGPVAAVLYGIRHAETEASAPRTRHSFVHYVQALAMRRKMHTAGALFSGRQPIQNAMVPGGVTTLFSSTYPMTPQSGTDYDHVRSVQCYRHGEQVQIADERRQDIH